MKMAEDGGEIGRCEKVIVVQIPCDNEVKGNNVTSIARIISLFEWEINFRAVPILINRLKSTNDKKSLHVKSVRTRNSESSVDLAED